MQLELLACLSFVVLIMTGLFWFWWDEFGPGHKKYYKWYYDWMDQELKEIKEVPMNHIFEGGMK